MNPTGIGGFKKGISGNPQGRPKKAKEDRYYEILITTCTKDDWKDIVKRAIYDAKRGDTAARTWLGNYIIGPPTEHKDITSGGLPIKGYALITPDDWDKVDGDTG
ncbi:MAG: hypothetical protein A2Y53_07635 [Chloroflexi bacterium RBG_16_47_49]|nr:MAG: hypothetical protein A2Y53_07635 [Chloroflexi bacterium RBG_16_47_49]